MKCEVVKDLLALYADDACSEQTKAEIEHHLEECETCSKALEEYKAELETPIVRDVDMDKVKPFKKTAKRLIVTTSIIAFIIFIVALVSLAIYADKKSLTIDYSFFKAYYSTKNQTQMLVDGDIDEFMDSVRIYHDRRDTIDTDEIKEDAKQLLSIFYDNYLKGKKTEVDIGDVVHGGMTADANNRAVEVNIDVKDGQDITIIYFWENNSCIVDFYSSANDKKEYEKFINQKLNPLFSIKSNLAYEYFPFVDKEANEKSLEFLSHYFYNVRHGEDSKESKQLVERILNVKKSVDFLSLNTEKIRYDKERKQILFDLSYTVEEKSSGKRAVFSQECILCSGYNIPIGKAKVIIDEGITKEKREKLLNLF